MTKLNRFLLLIFTVLSAMNAAAQGSVRGRVLDKQTDEALQFVNIKLTRGEKLVQGSITDVNGSFHLTNIPDGQYTLTVSFVGYKTLTRRVNMTPQNRRHTYPALYLTEDSKTLKEVQVTGQRSQMKLEVDRKTFSVDNVLAAAGGNATELLEQIPSIEVTTDGEISLRGNSSVEVWINGKASGMTSDNRYDILQQIPAESIERVEVIDNPSAKFSAEGSAGIINIILKRDRKAGYYGSLQAGGNQHGGYNFSGNINYSNKWVDAYANVGRRRRRGGGGSNSEQQYPLEDTFMNIEADNDNRGRGLFGRAGLTFHISPDDDLSLSGMALRGSPSSDNVSTYDYGVLSTGELQKRMLQTANTGDGSRRMLNAELVYNHKFNESGTHKLDATVSFNKWHMDNTTVYRNDTTFFNGSPATYSQQLRPMDVNNRNWEAKLEYENRLSETLKLEAGYNGRFSHENTPQESQMWNDAQNRYEDEAFFYNRFIYDMDVHALYATTNIKFGRFSVMAGLRGEYWKVDTKSYDYYQDHPDVPIPAGTPESPEPFKKDFFQLFPSLFLSYELTPSAQIQLNYTRRLRRPWGGQLNSFKNTRDASMIEFGNPQLTPEFTHSFSVNFLKTWENHTLSFGTYYRPATDVIQRIRYQGLYDGQTVMYMTNLNVAKSQRAGAELIVKDKLFRILDLTTTLNAYYYKLDGFSTIVEGWPVSGEGNEDFSWDARMLASFILPYDISLQATGNYRSRGVITQGYRKANGSLDLGLRKSFFNKTLALAVNWRDVFNTRHWQNYTSSDTFNRHQENWRDPVLNFTLTWNFGNMTSKKKKRGDDDDDRGGSDDDMNSGFDSGGGFQD